MGRLSVGQEVLRRQVMTKTQRALFWQKGGIIGLNSAVRSNSVTALQDLNVCLLYRLFNQVDINQHPDANEDRVTRGQEAGNTTY